MPISAVVGGAAVLAMSAALPPEVLVSAANSSASLASLLESSPHPESAAMNTTRLS